MPYIHLSMLQKVHSQGKRTTQLASWTPCHANHQQVGCADVLAMIAGHNQAAFHSGHVAVGLPISMRHPADGHNAHQSLWIQFVP